MTKNEWHPYQDRCWGCSRFHELGELQIERHIDYVMKKGKIFKQRTNAADVKYIGVRCESNGNVYCVGFLSHRPCQKDS